MIRLAALLVLAACSTGFAADNVTLKVTFRPQGGADVFMIFNTTLETPDRVAAIPDPRVKGVLFVRALRASPGELTAFLSRASFGNVAVSQYAEGTHLRTEVTAVVSDLQPLGRLLGGELEYVPIADHFHELRGTFGGALAGLNADLSALSNTHLTLWVVFRGTARKADRTAEISHAADSVTWRFTGDRLLAQPRTLDAVVLPRIEGDPKFWLALIVGVTALVVIGAAIVLRRGRDARV